jgi:hypothetical protein
MGDLEGEIPVIRHDQHAFGVVIQPAHGIDADLDPFQQVLHRGPTFGVGHGRDKTHGFIQHNIRFRLMRIDKLAVDFDVVLGRVGLGSEFRHHLAVHAHPAFGDQLFCGPARSYSRGGYDFLDTFFHVFLSWISTSLR